MACQGAWRRRIASSTLRIGNGRGRSQQRKREVGSTTAAKVKKGRHKHHDGLKQRGGARRGADGRLKKSSPVLVAGAAGIYVQGYPVYIGISEKPPARADSGMSKHNTEATQTSCLTLHRHSSTSGQTSIARWPLRATTAPRAAVAACSPATRALGHGRVRVARRALWCPVPPRCAQLQQTTPSAA